VKKKILLSLLAIVVCITLVGCGNDESLNKNNENNNQKEQNENGNDITTNDNNNTSDKNDSNESNNNTENVWNDSKYTEYTNGLEEPNVKYAIKGVIMDQLTLNLEVTETELESYKQSLIDKGFELYRDGDSSWGMSNDTHNIQMNGYYNGIAYIYIALK